MAFAYEGIPTLFPSSVFKRLKDYSLLQTATGLPTYKNIVIFWGLDILKGRERDKLTTAGKLKREGQNDETWHSGCKDCYSSQSEAHLHHGIDLLLVKRHLPPLLRFRYYTTTQTLHFSVRVESTSSPSSKLAAACAPVANTLMRKSAIPFRPIHILSFLPVLIYIATDDLVWATGKKIDRYRKRTSVENSCFYSLF